MLRLDLFDYSDAYFVIKGTIDIVNPNNDGMARDKFLEINSTLIDNAEELDIGMPMYNLLEHRKNCSKTTGIWNYCRDEPNSGTARDVNYYIRN